MKPFNYVEIIAIQVFKQISPYTRPVAKPSLKSLDCPTILLIAGGRKVGFMPFPKGIWAIWNANSLVLNLNSGRRVHFHGHHDTWTYTINGGFRDKMATVVGMETATRVQILTRLFTFHIELIPLGKVWFQLFSFQLGVNSRVDRAL